MTVKTIIKFFDDLADKQTDVKVKNALHGLKQRKIQTFKKTGKCILNEELALIACK